MFQPYVAQPGLEPLPISLCIVTNSLDAKLERIIDVCSQVCLEILIGYDNKGVEDYLGFTENRQTKIIPIEWEGYSRTKNNLAAAARYEWVLSLDGDEIPDEKLLTSISHLQLDSLSKHQLFFFKRVSILGNYKILFGSWGGDTVIRLYNKSYTHWGDEKVHERLVQPSGSTLVKLKGVLYHYTAANFDEYLNKNRMYAKLSADKYFAQGKLCPTWKIYLKTGFTFFKEYIIQFGFLDGLIGLRLAKGNAQYTYWKYTQLKALHQSAANSSNKLSI